jgi:hypothetical protein
MIPDEEQRRLDEAVDMALLLADEGRIGYGYQQLSEGLMRARNPEVQGQPWGKELAQLWENACQNYADSFGLPLA